MMTLSAGKLELRVIVRLSDERLTFAFNWLPLANNAKFAAVTVLPSSDSENVRTISVLTLPTVVAPSDGVIAKTCGDVVSAAPSAVVKLDSIVATLPLLPAKSRIPLEDRIR